MRLVPCACLSLLVAAAGCGALTDVGAGRIPAVTIEGNLDLPSAAARAGVREASWKTDAGEQLTVRAAAPANTVLTVEKELEFLSGEQAAAFAARLGDKRDSVDHIDVQVQELALLDGAAPADAAPVSGLVVFDGVGLGPTGFVGRVSLGDEQKRHILDSLAAGRAVELPFAVELSCPPDHLEVVPATVQVHVVLQPILVVRALGAL